RRAAPAGPARAVPEFPGNWGPCAAGPSGDRGPGSLPAHHYKLWRGDARLPALILWMKRPPRHPGRCRPPAGAVRWPPCRAQSPTEKSRAMSYAANDFLEEILRGCAAAAPQPWYPREYARARGIDRDSLDRPLERLRLGGLVQLTDWVQGLGQ